MSNLNNTRVLESSKIKVEFDLPLNITTINNDEEKITIPCKNNEIIKETVNLYEECPICFEFLDTKLEVCTLSCNHKFHLNCLISWYRKPNSNYKCPLCVVHREIILIENTKPISTDIEIPVIYETKQNKKCIIM
jgi:hypothetical protein